MRRPSAKTHQQQQRHNSLPAQTNMGEQAQSTNFKEAFSLFDKRGNGRVQLRDLGDLLRACGQNPTLAEIKELESQVGGDCEWHTYHRSIC